MVVAKEKEFWDLRERMDVDEKLYLLDDYKLRKWNKQIFFEAYHVTRNTPRVFAQAVMGDLESAEIIPLIESNDKQLNTARFEEFYNSMWEATNEWSGNAYQYSVDKYINEFMTVRGSIVSRILFQVEDLGLGEGMQLIPDIMNWDPRWCVWQIGSYGRLEWGAYKCKRRKDMVVQDFGINEEIVEKIERAFKDKAEGEVADFWGREVHELYVNGTQIYSEPNVLKYVPLIIQPSDLGSVLITTDNTMEYWGESIYAPLRKLYPELNRLASVKMSMTMEGWRAALMLTNRFQGQDPPTITSPPARAAGGGERATVDMLPTPAGTEVERFYPLEDMNNASTAISQEFEQDEQQAQYSNVDYGILASKDMSGELAKVLSSKRSRIIRQITSAQSIYRRKVCRMVSSQMEGIKNAKLGAEGRRKIYSGVDLKGDYSIEYQYRVKTPEQDIANFAMAGKAMELGWDMRTILEDIIEAQDPEKVLGRMALQRMRDKYEDVDAMMAALEVLNIDMPEMAKVITVHAGVPFEALLYEAEQLKQVMSGRMPALPQEAPGRTQSQNPDISKKSTSGIQLPNMMKAAGAGGQGIRKPSMVAPVKPVTPGVA